MVAPSKEHTCGIYNATEDLFLTTKIKDVPQDYWGAFLLCVDLGDLVYKEGKGCEIVADVASLDSPSIPLHCTIYKPKQASCTASSSPSSCTRASPTRPTATRTWPAPAWPVSACVCGWMLALAR